MEMLNPLYSYSRSTGFTSVSSERLLTECAAEGRFVCRLLEENFCEQAFLLVKLKKSKQRDWLTHESLTPNPSTDSNKHHT
jgi:hypothetical protein